MDVVTRNLERAFALFPNIFSPTNHFLMLTAAGFLFVMGLFLVITAILFKMFSS